MSCCTSQYTKEYLIKVSFLSLATISWLKAKGYSSGNTDGTKIKVQTRKDQKLY